MKEKDKEFLRNHPYFLKEEKEVFYLKKNKITYEINLNGNLESSYPITCTAKENHFFTMWQTEEWFKKIFIEVNELYFQKNRVRLITKGIKRRLENIIFCACLLVEDGQKIDYELEKIMVREEIFFPKQYEQILLLIKKMAEKERYEVVIEHVNDEKIAITVR